MACGACAVQIDAGLNGSDPRLTSLSILNFSMAGLFSWTDSMSRSEATSMCASRSSTPLVTLSACAARRRRPFWPLKMASSSSSSSSASSSGRGPPLPPSSSLSLQQIASPYGDDANQRNLLPTAVALMEVVLYAA